MARITKKQLRQAKKREMYKDIEGLRFEWLCLRFPERKGKSPDNAAVKTMQAFCSDLVGINSTSFQWHGWHGACRNNPGLEITNHVSELGPAPNLPRLLDLFKQNAETHHSRRVRYFLEDRPFGRTLVFSL